MSFEVTENLVTGNATGPLHDATGSEVGSYLNSITRARLLTASEEKSLARRVRSGDSAARTRLIEANMRLVVNIARSYHSNLIQFEDLVQEGAIGLMTAAERFDPEKGYRFSTYATHWIKQSISRDMDNKSRAIRVPAHINESLRKLEKLRNSSARTAGEDLDVEELVKLMGMSPAKISALLRTAMDTISLDTLVGDEENTSLATLLDDKNALNPALEVIRAEVKAELKRVMESLDEREQRVMRRRLGFDDEESPVLQDIGIELQLSRERVRQIESQAIKKMRRLSPRLKEFLMD